MTKITTTSTFKRVETLVKELKKEGREADAFAINNLLKVVKRSTKAYLTTTQAGQRLGVSHQTIKNWVKKGLIKGKRIGGRILIPASVFEGFEKLEEASNALEPYLESYSQEEISSIIDKGRKRWKR